MSEIADAAGISKALLFHYFHNKKELYLFLWDTCCRITVEEMMRSGAYEQTDLFGSMDYGMQAKLRLMRQFMKKIRRSARIFKKAWGSI